MKRLLSDIRALRHAYYADQTVFGDVVDVLVAAICTVGILAHVLFGFTLWELHYG